MFLILLSLNFTVFAQENFDEGYLWHGKEYCEHQGYEYKLGLYENGSQYKICIFNENENCSIKDFYNNDCGTEFIRVIGCRREGEQIVTSFEICCEGLEPDYSWIGGVTCMKERSSFQKFLDWISFWN